MGKKKKKNDMANAFMRMFQGMMPMMPAVPVMPFMPPFGNGMYGMNFYGAGKEKEDTHDWMEAFGSNMETYWDQMIDMQKSSMETAKEQWEQFFEHLMEMMDVFADSLSDEAMAVPFMFFGQSFSISPKKFAKWMRKLQKTANEHFMEQADSVNDLVIKGQEQVRDMLCEAKEEKAEEKEDADGTKDGEDEPDKADSANDEPHEGENGKEESEKAKKGKDTAKDKK